MTSYRSSPRRNLLPATAWFFSIALCAAQTPQRSSPTKSMASQSGVVRGKTYSSDLVEAGRGLFRQDCSFCHGRDATGGETGPDLTRSRLVREDIGGEKIAPVLRNGRPDRGMPPFELTAQQISSLAAFIHSQQDNAAAAAGRAGNGGRKGVDASDLQTGNAEAGRSYFNGAGGCAACHSPTGDLAGIASRYEGLELEKQMLYPKHAKSKIIVTTLSGQTIAGTLAYEDEFTIGLTDSSGTYRSWRTRDVRYKISAPVNAHVDLFSRYTDADVHNLMAYLQTLH